MAPLLSWHGSELSTSTSHSVPLHVHVQLPSVLLHVAMGWHRDSAHSFTSVHFKPSPPYPALQRQSNDQGIWTHVASPSHLSSSHSLPPTGTHAKPSVPTYPTLHSQLKLPGSLVQLALLSQ